MLIELGGDNKESHLHIPADRFVNPYKNPSITLGYRTTPQHHLNGRDLEYLRGKGLGGSSIANFLAYIRGTASDYNRWADLVGDESWKWENVVERYKEIENLHFNDDHDPDEFVKLKENAHGFEGPVDLQLPSRSEWPQGLDTLMEAAKTYGWPVNPDQNSGNIIGLASVTTTVHKGRRVTSGSAYLLNPPTNLVIWTRSTVTKVLFDTTGAKPKATGVLLADGRSAKAVHEVILSLGTIDTPKLLKLSGIGPRDELQRFGIPCLVDRSRVGKDLIDHTYLVMIWGVNSSLGTRVSQHTKDYTDAARAQWLQDQTGPLATLNTINLIGFFKSNRDRVIVDELDKLDPTTKAYLNEPDVPHFEFYTQGYVPEGWDRKNGDECLGVALMLMNPQSRGEVRLASSNPADDPVIEANYLSHPYDRQTIVNAVKEGMMFVRSAGVAPYVVGKVLAPESERDEDVHAFVKKELMSILHGVGTVMMGRQDDQSAPLDTAFRVRGVDGLRVVDLSVCPTITK